MNEVRLDDGGILVGGDVCTYSSNDLMHVRGRDLAWIDEPIRSQSAFHSLSAFFALTSTQKAFLTMGNLRVDSVDDGLGTAESQHGQTTRATTLRHCLDGSAKGEKRNPKHLVGDVR